jgi:hypothetical protein
MMIPLHKTESPLLQHADWMGSKVFIESDAFMALTDAGNQYS